MSNLPKAPLFLYEQLALQDRMVDLAGDEAIHATKSRRLGEGDPLHLTNGKGLLGMGTITALERKPLSIRIQLESLVDVPRPRTEVVLASSLPKGDRLQTLLDMGTQLGMAAFQPLESARSVVRFQPRMRERWQRIISSAAKQCRQPHFPEILEPTTPDRLAAGGLENNLLIYGDADGKSICHAAQGIMPPPLRLTLAVGPEGGFDDREIRSLRDGFNAIGISCGPLILRTETAGPALLSAVNQWLATHEPPDR